jgi:hypothetical protein
MVLSSFLCRCFGIISAAGIRTGVLGEVWSAVEASGLRIARAKMVQLSSGDVPSVASGLAEPGLAAPGPAIVLEVRGC